MATIEAYLERQSTPLLELLLEEYCNGREDLMPSVVVNICEILARRDPRKPPIEDSLRDLSRIYLPK